jgi:hypothetical protein
VGKIGPAGDSRADSVKGDEAMMTNCEECGGRVSDIAKRCPHCGVTFKTTKVWIGLAWVAIGLMVAAIGAGGWLIHLQSPKLFKYLRGPESQESQQAQDALNQLNKIFPGQTELYANIRLDDKGDVVVTNLDAFTWKNTRVCAGGTDVWLGDVRPKETHVVPAAALASPGGNWVLRAVAVYCDVDGRRGRANQRVMD